MTNTANIFMDNPPRTVLQVVPRLVTGGVERGTIEIAKAIIDYKWNAIVASEGGPMVKELEAMGATHITLPLASKHPLQMYKNITALQDVINEHGVDIVHARSRAPAWSAYYAAIETDTHFVTTCHNAYGGTNWFKRKYNSVMMKGELVIAISEFVANYAETTYRVPREKIRTIHRGVDVERFNRRNVEMPRILKLREEWQIDAEKPVIMLPGRLSYWKGHDVFIAAVAQMQQKNVTCLIVGSGDENEKRAIEIEIAAKVMQDHVRMADECDDMPAAFAIADVVVSASTRPEGFGRVIVEAQAMGCPVIATRHGGAEETVLNGKTGWLITPNDPKVLATALDKILAMPPETRKKIGEQAASHVRTNFSSTLMKERTIAVYEEIMKSNAPP